jgi:hypothetical protein
MTVMMKLWTCFVEVNTFLLVHLFFKKKISPWYIHLIFVLIYSFLYEGLAVITPEKDQVFTAGATAKVTVSKYFQE